MSDAGQIYSDMGQHVGHNIEHAYQIYQQGQRKQDTSKALYGYLDMARRLEVPDPKTGKPKTVFDQKSLDIIESMLAHHNTAGAAAQEAAMGIGRGMVERYQNAAAKQQAAFQKQQDLQQSVQQGPILTTVPGRGNYRWTGKEYVPDTAVPRNTMGLDANQQLDLQKGIAKDANQAQLAQFKAQQQAKIAQTKAFSAFLKSNGIASPTDLFDPTIQEGGAFDPGKGFVNKQPDQQGDPTHIRFYYRPPDKDESGNPKLNAQGNPVGEKRGVVLPTTQVIGLQDAAAQMAGPQAVQALQWLRQNPDNKHASAVANEISRRMSEVPQAPTPAPFNPSPPSAAPAQPPTAAFQQGQQPTVVTPDETDVSDEAADQNPGY